MLSQIPIITVDGPSGSGKGTLSRQLAHALKWHFLDSGALYRVLAWAALKRQIPLEEEERLAQLGDTLQVVFSAEGDEVWLEGEEVTQAVRSENCGNYASRIAALGTVRHALLGRQRAWVRPPGLVADGRDMGTVVFPEALLKFFLEATAEERAKRRQIQLKAQGRDVSLVSLSAEIAERDMRDRTRLLSPLVPAGDAVRIETTGLSISEVFECAWAEVLRRGIEHRG